jgi:60 kDa SS-A/Ro ribonucleoprotein
MSYLNKHVDKNQIPQSEPLDKRQVENNAGGFVYKIDKWNQLHRFLILGTMGGTYYVNERKHTRDNLDQLDACLDEDGLRAIAAAVEVSTTGRAPKNDQAVLLLAKASLHKDLQVRRAAADALPRICRIGTHLYQFVAFRKMIGDVAPGSGKITRKAISDWFNEKKPEKLAYQVAKYKSRENWSAADLLRTVRPVPASAEHEAIFAWILGDPTPDKDGKTAERAPRFGERVEPPDFLQACDEAQKADEKRVVKLIEEYNLPREVIPTEMLNSKAIWQALLQKMPMTALIRNLGKMSSIGILADGSAQTREVCQRIGNEEALQRARIHPINMLMAMKVYDLGQGVKGKLSWKPVSNILAAMDDAFYMCFKNVEPTGKATLMALDISGSMGSTWNNSGLLTAREISAAMAMVTLRTEKEWCTVMGFSHSFTDLDIKRNDSLSNVLLKVSRLPFGATDCALPALWAKHNRVKVDAIYIYTDNETWFGNVHPKQALRDYRRKTGIDTRQVICATETTDFSIADPKDPLSLDIAGFDSATPNIMSDFVKGLI